jgi:uncharacterized protein (DUF2249 family)
MNPPPAELDIRPLCAAQCAPLPAILNAVSQLEEGQNFRLIAPFEPTPLYKLLGERGFSHVTRHREDGAFTVTFERETAPKAQGASAPAKL